MYQINDVTGDREVIAYYSRTLKGAELNYTVTEKEALAIVTALTLWRVFILGRKLTVLTDHKALSFLQTYKLLSSRLSRWVLLIQEYSAHIHYCKGSDNVVADALSRYPIQNKNSNEIIMPESNGNYVCVVTDVRSPELTKGFKQIEAL